MKSFAHLICVLGLLLLSASVATANPFIEYQEIVIIEPYNGGGGGADCLIRHTIRIYSNGMESHTSEMVCQ